MHRCIFIPNIEHENVPPLPWSFITLHIYVWPTTAGLNSTATSVEDGSVIDSGFKTVDWVAVGTQLITLGIPFEYDARIVNTKLGLDWTKHRLSSRTGAMKSTIVEKPNQTQAQFIIRSTLPDPTSIRIESLLTIQVYTPEGNEFMPTGIIPTLLASEEGTTAIESVFMLSWASKAPLGRRHATLSDVLAPWHQRGLVAVTSLELNWDNGATAETPEPICITSIREMMKIIKLQKHKNYKLHTSWL